MSALPDYSEGVIVMHCILSFTTPQTWKLMFKFRDNFSGPRQRDVKLRGQIYAPSADDRINMASLTQEAVYIIDP